MNRILFILGAITLLLTQFSCCTKSIDPLELPSADKTKIQQNFENTFVQTASAAYAEDCDAYENLFIEVIITDEAMYDTWRSCQYYLKVTNNHEVQAAWVWVHDIHATEIGVDRDVWNSFKIEPGATNERAYSGSFQDDGTFGHSYASEITAIIAIAECSDMREKSNAITLSRPVTWFCGP